MVPAECPDSKSDIFFYNFETQQDSGVHKAIYVDVGWSCSNCMDIPHDYEDRQVDRCKICEFLEKDRHVSFEGEGCVEDLCEWLFEVGANQIEHTDNGKKKTL